MNLTFTLLGIIATGIALLSLKDYIWLGLFALILGIMVDACAYNDSKAKGDNK